jgi:hypothetical protein
MVTIDGTKPYTAMKSARSDINFAVEGLPKGKELSSPASPNNLASALTAVTLADVRKAQELTMKPGAHATLKTFDGLVVEADGWVQDNKHFIVLTTAYDDTLASRFKTSVAPAPGETATKAPATKPQTERDVASEAKNQNAQLTGWAYEIPEYKYDAIFKPLDELLKKDEPKNGTTKKKTPEATTG